MSLQGKLAFVTGGASGNGAAICHVLASAGAQVVVSDVNVADANTVSEQIGAAGGTARVVELDVRSEPAWEAAVAAVMEREGHLDIMVNNAGVATTNREFESLSLADFQRVQDVNLDGVFLGTREAVKAMRASGGSIINVSSIYGLVGGPFAAAYNASKGGVRLLTKSVALYCQAKKLDIRVNSIHPGFIKTPMVEGIEADLGAKAYQEFLATIRRDTPMGRLGEATDVAHAVRFLASDESRFMTGTELVMDGGFTAR